MFPIIDLHCDTLCKLARTPGQFMATQDAAVSHIFYPGLCSAGTMLQCFALFTDLCAPDYPSPLHSVREQYTCFRKFLSLTEDRMVQVRSFPELKKCLAQNKIATLLTLEESCLSDTPITLLPTLHALGVRMATLTWDYSNRLATPANITPPPYAAGFSGLTSPLLRRHAPGTGLTPEGFDFLAEAEHLGILIDVSHLSDAGFYDVAAHSQKPFLASHSNARAICNVPRNLSDDMLRLLGKRGGLVGLTLHEPFLTSRAVSPDELLTVLARHAKHILTVAGSDVLALGTDFDGTPGNSAIPDVTCLCRLEDAFRKAGLTATQIEKIFYQNALVFLAENLK